MKLFFLMLLLPYWDVSFISTLPLALHMGETIMIMRMIQLSCDPIM